MTLGKRVMKTMVLRRVGSSAEGPAGMRSADCWQRSLQVVSGNVLRLVRQLLSGEARTKGTPLSKTSGYSARQPPRSAGSCTSALRRRHHLERPAGTTTEALTLKLKDAPTHTELAVQVLVGTQQPLAPETVLLHLRRSRWPVLQVRDVPSDAKFLPCQEWHRVAVNLRLARRIQTLHRQSSVQQSSVVTSTGVGEVATKVPPDFAKIRHKLKLLTSLEMATTT